MSSSVPVKTLLITVTESIVEVFILCLAGYVLSRAGVTDKATQRKLNVINVSLFTPALLFSKVAYSLTPSKLKEMWIIPLGFVIVTGLSAFVAWVLSKAFRLKKSQTAFAMCAAMFQNSNSLPIALIQSLVLEVPGLKWGSDDTKDQMLGRALTYLVLYSTLGMMFRWSYGVKLLSAADDEAETVKEVPVPQAEPASYISGDQVRSPDQLPHVGARETDPFFTTTKSMTRDEEDERRNPSRTMSRPSGRAASESNSFDPPQVSAHSLHPVRRESSVSDARHRTNSSRLRSQSQSSTHRRPLTRSESGREFWGLPQFPKRDRILLEEDSSDESDIDEENEEDEEWGSTTPLSLNRRRRQEGSRFKSATRKTKTWLKSALSSINAFMTVPMYAALLSIFIAMIPPLQAAMAKLKPVEQAIRSAGACSIPVTLVVLGAFFYTPPQPAPPANTLATIPEGQEGFVSRHMRKIRKFELGNPEYPGENRAVFVAVISRMIITPLLLLPGIALLAKYDLFEAAEDPVFILAAVLLVSSPPALTLAQITQAASGDAFERLISKTISWSYAVLTPPLTLAYVVIGLVFGRL